MHMRQQLCDLFNEYCRPTIKRHILHPDNRNTHDLYLVNIPLEFFKLGYIVHDCHSNRRFISSVAHLDKRIDEMGLPKENYWWYRDLRRYGTIPHAGFGLGFERMILRRLDD